MWPVPEYPIEDDDLQEYRGCGEVPQVAVGGVQRRLDVASVLRVHTGFECGFRTRLQLEVVLGLEPGPDPLVELQEST